MLTQTMKIIHLAIGLSICLLFFSCKKTSNGSVNPGDTLKNGLIAYYPFNGNIRDESGNGYDLSGNGPLITDNRFGEAQKAYKFNGTSDFLIIPGILKADSLRELTISVWVKVENLAYSTILSFLPKDIRICSSALSFDNFANSYSTRHKMITELQPLFCNTLIIKDTITNPLGVWRHVVLVQRDISVNIQLPRYAYTPYYDGKKQKVATTLGGMNPFVTSFGDGGIIGGDNNSGNYNFNFDFFKGSIDDIRIYNRALTDKEVVELYNLHE